MTAYIINKKGGKFMSKVFKKLEKESQNKHTKKEGRQCEVKPEITENRKQRMTNKTKTDSLKG